MKIVSLVFCYIALLPKDSYGYIDPGTGSLIMQALIAGGITALAFVRGIRNKIVSFFRIKKGK